MMPVGETVSMAMTALRANKMRSMLTMLGVVIGVGAVIAMVAIGNGAQEAVNARISALGTTLISISPGQIISRGVASSTDRARLKMADADALRNNAVLITQVEPEMQKQAQVQYLNKNTSTAIIGTTPNYTTVRLYTVAAGRMFTNAEDKGSQLVAVLGDAVLQDLGITDGASIIGQTIRIQGIQFKIIGTLAPKGQGTGFGNPDDQILIPITTARYRIVGVDQLRTINVLAPTDSLVTQTMAEAQSILARAHRLRPGSESDINIRSQADFLNTLGATTATFTYLLAGIAAVSLIVGGIGIMNIMLVSVTERTREIGVRKALGATRINILLQFLIEAVVLCMLGGIGGIVIGGGGALLMTKIANWNASISPSAVFIAFAFSALVGVLFGVWPARRAAALNPIEALRYE
ncbi:MAG: ABC transporter permease [Gemmatimonadota bacterium]|nr:ABC transporter permease [Gemmatimonadota bacterium]